MTTVDPLSPQDRLVTTRNAILQHMLEKMPAGQRSGRGFSDAPADLPGWKAAGRSRWQYYLNAVQVWWQHHPAQVVVALARPSLNRYAEKQPLRLVSLAAGAGALAVLLKPWRLVSVTGLLLATLKSSQVSGLVMSLLTRSKSKVNREIYDERK